LIKKSLLPLALGGFGIGMTEFVMMGILPDIAGGLHITIPQAGYLITAYALGVVVGAPTLVSLLAKRPPRTVLIWFMLMFAVFNALSALAPNFWPDAGIALPGRPAAWRLLRRRRGRRQPPGRRRERWPPRWRPCSPA
jgi:predicted MFS family arabinose efflux permease